MPDSKEFSIDDRVRAPCGTALDPDDKLGTVESYYDW